MRLAGRPRGDRVLEQGRGGRAAAAREPAAARFRASKMLLSMKSDRLNKPGHHGRSSKFTARGRVTRGPASLQGPGRYLPKRINVGSGIFQ